MKKNKEKKMFGVIAIVVVIFLIFAVFIAKNKFLSLVKPCPPSYPYILNLTYPINRLDAWVKSIEKNRIMVEAVDKKNIFNVLVNDKTLLRSYDGFMIPYTFRKNKSLKNIKFSDLKVGDLINLTTNTDLRLLQTPSFETISVLVKPQSSVFSGKVISVKDNVLSILTEDANKEISFNVISDTEIVQFNPLKELVLSDLKKDMKVDVFADGDTKNKENMQKVFKINVQ